MGGASYPRGWHLIALLAMGTPPAFAAPMLRDGQWGGDRIQLTVSAEGAAVRLDCARGAVPAPLSLDRKGRFDWAGTFEHDRPGPTRVAEPAARRDIGARYTGRITGDVMDLDIRATDGSPIWHGALARDRRTKLVRCL